MHALARVLGLAAAPGLVLPLIVSLAGAAATLLLHGPARFVTFVLWFSIVNASIAPNPTSYGTGTPGYRQAMLSLFREADRFTTDLDPTLRGIKYWWPVEQAPTPQGVVPTGPIFDSFVATRAWLVNLLARRSPGLPIDQLTLAHLARGECIGVLSTLGSQAQLRRTMESHYAGLGRPLHQVAARRFERPEISFALTILKPSNPAPRLAATGEEAPCAFRAEP